MYFKKLEAAVAYAKTLHYDVNIVKLITGEYMPVNLGVTAQLLTAGAELVCEIRWEPRVRYGTHEPHRGVVHNYGEPEV